MSNSNKPRCSLAGINESSRETFVSAFGDLFEHAPWVAERAWDARPFASRAALFEALRFVLGRAGNAAKLELIRAHPELAGKAARADQLTQFSSREQAAAGLDACTADEVASLQALNQRYRKKFGFPCIIAVKGLDKTRILAGLEARLGNTRDAEFAENLRQILKIARFRLEELVDPE